VAMIFQELSLVPAMSVADNLFLGREPLLFGGRIDRRRIRREADELIAGQGFALDPDALVEDLPFAARQQVEILKALSRRASVIVMDEPTSSLTVREEEVLHATIAQLRATGIGVVYISHRMSEIFRVADRLSIIKDGHIQGPFATEQITIPEVSRLMARSASVVVMKPKARREPGEIVLEVVDLGTARKLRDVGLAVRAGEIVGIAGLVGSGRSTLAKALFGLIPDARGDVQLSGREIGALATPPRIRAGMALVPEDRRAEGLVAQHSLAANVALPNLAELTSRWPGVLSWRRETEMFLSFRDALHIACREPGQPASELSGGNQQKVVFAKWFASNPKLLILDEPTAGVDVNAKAEMRTLVLRAAEKGMAVLLITSELDELAGLADRLIYMVDGRLVPGEATPRGEEEIRTVLQQLATIHEAA
ncbi:sugar ABC transporter ATP-binding protein, partial [Mesorhizobium sp. M7A.F.Ca.CA.001.09.2.1]|uniref:sugar ABC transporter ATP-binding protein n=1 Tax=Mesorhizobium sp. M7A.F.Ca.CA.001.09.2.1 TaxID=2496719 RepID=UPI000FD22976